MTAVLEQVETKKPGKPMARWVLAGVALWLVGAAVITELYLTVPKSNEGAGPVDALVVLGTPADLHGELTEMQRWRVDEAVREFRAGRAPRIVFSGGPTANVYVEADVMAGYARSQGVPETAILEERRSHTTVQNVANTTALVRAHGWESVEVISTPEHLRRAAVLLETTGLRWRVHAAPTPGRGRIGIAGAYAEEAVGTAAFRVFGTRAEPVLHLLALVQHRVAWGFRWLLYKAEGSLGRR